jgi:hypothetical protein
MQPVLGQVIAYKLGSRIEVSGGVNAESGGGIGIGSVQVTEPTYLLLNPLKTSCGKKDTYRCRQQLQTAVDFLNDPSFQGPEFAEYITSTREVVEKYQDQYRDRVLNPLAQAELDHPVAFGGVRAAGGAAYVVGGVVACWGSGTTACALSVPVSLYGADQFAAGVRQMVDGTPQSTYYQDFLVNQVGLDPNKGAVAVDLATGLGLGVGPALFTRAPTVPSMAANGSRVVVDAEMAGGGGFFGRTVLRNGEWVHEFQVEPPITSGGTANAATYPKLVNQLLFDAGRSVFKADGTLTQEAIDGATKIIDPSLLKNPAIPPGFGKYSTETFQSPSGDFQVYFYKNPTTGEVFYGLDYKAVFNNMSGVPRKP